MSYLYATVISFVALLYVINLLILKYVQIKFCFQKGKLKKSQVLQEIRCEVPCWSWRIHCKIWEVNFEIELAVKTSKDFFYKALLNVTSLYRYEV